MDENRGKEQKIGGGKRGRQKRGERRYGMRGEESEDNSGDKKSREKNKEREIRGVRIREENKFIPRTLDLDIINWNNFEGVIEGYQLPDPEIEKHDFIKKPYIELIQN